MISEKVFMQAIEAKEDAENQERITRHKLSDTWQDACRFADLLKKIAYPKRGHEEEIADIYEAANLIMANFSIDDLEKYK